MRKAANRDNPKPDILLHLYVAGQTPKSLATISNLKKICSGYLGGRYKIEGET